MFFMQLAVLWRVKKLMIHFKLGIRLLEDYHHILEFFKGDLVKYEAINSICILTVPDEFAPDENQRGDSLIKIDIGVGTEYLVEQIERRHKVGSVYGKSMNPGIKNAFQIVGYQLQLRFVRFLG